MTARDSTADAVLARLRDRLAADAEAAGLLDVAYRTVDTPVGPLLLAATDAGLVRVAFAREGHDRVLADLALVPYSKISNDDSHYLRTDLGPVPNIITSGRGSGVQLDLELRYAWNERLEAGIGVRHWELSKQRANVSLGGVTVPVTEFETRRTGVTATIVGRW